jgi:hypothetical protein
MAHNTKPMKEKAVKTPLGGAGITVLECGVIYKYSTRWELSSAYNLPEGTTDPETISNVPISMSEIVVASRHLYDSYLLYTSSTLRRSTETGHVFNRPKEERSQSNIYG